MKAFIMYMAVAVLTTRGAVAAEERSPFDQSVDPENHVWKLSSYLKGKPADIRKTLDSEITSLARKAGIAAREAEQANADYATRKAIVTTTLHASKEYKTAVADVAAAEKALEQARRGSDPKRKLDASSRFNKARAVVDKMDRGITLDSELQSHHFKRQTATLRSLDLRAKAKKAMEWRRTLVDAAHVSATLRAPVVDGETTGILAEVTVVEVDEKSVLVDFELYREVGSTDDGEGIATVQLRGRVAKVMLDRKEVPNATVGKKVALYGTYRIAKTLELTSGDVLIARRYPTDMEYFLDHIRQPPDVDAIIESTKRDASVGAGARKG